MRRILLGLALTLATPPAWAQTRDASVAQCQSDDADISIAGCTALIQSGREPPAVLAAVYYNRGRAEVAKGLNDQAITDLNDAIALTPNDNEAYDNRANAYLNKGLYDQAIVDFNKAIELKPDWDAHYNRGRTYEKTGQRDQAIADYRAALKFDPNDDGSQQGLKRLGATP